VFEVLSMIKVCYETSSYGLKLKGVSRVIDCPVDGFEVHLVPDAKKLVEKAIRAVFELSPREVTFDSSESIGYTHTLHRFKVPVLWGKYVGARVVVAGRKAIRVLFTVPEGVDLELKYRAKQYSPEADLAKVSDVESSNSTRLPRGQVYVEVPIVYAILGVPEINLSKWLLRVDGFVERQVDLGLTDLYEIGVESIKADFHCVTGWSARDLEFTGVSTRRVVELVKPLNHVKWVYVESMDGYSTIIPYEEFTKKGAIIALEMNNRPLDTLHGYPTRLVVPHLYGWKSAKWVKKITFTDVYVDGYWESLGYHPRGRVDLEERFKTN